MIKLFLRSIVLGVAVLGLVASGVCLAAPPAPVAEQAAAMKKINLNTAGVKGLQTLPSIGKVTAENIVAYRTEKGPFVSVEDLSKVKGIGKKTLEKIRQRVTLE